GLSVSFNSSENPASAGFLLLGGKMNDCPTTLYPKERGLSVSFNSLETPLRRGFCFLPSSRHLHLKLFIYFLTDQHP
ncbi:hypothetical protein, partial [Leclercia sp. Colony189]|uniref:hypothetical protein n=1 Tax=Leclercia sp. Colony189 TaxID=2681309 RepID=UPI001BDC6EC7